MEQWLLFISFLYIILILYVHYRYNHDPKVQNEIEIYREELEIEPALAAYLIDDNYEWTNLILADILTLVKQGYIQLEKQGEDYQFIKKPIEEKSKIKNHQMMAYQTLFSINGKEVEKISLKEFKEQMKEPEVMESLQIKEHAIKNAIRMELVKQGLIDPIAKKKLFRYNKLAISILILAIITCVITILSGQVLYEILSAFWIINSILFYMVTNYHEEKLTPYGAECREKAIGLKHYIHEYSISEDKPMDAINVLDYYYIMAVATGEADLAEEQFIKEEYQKEKYRKKLNYKEKRRIQSIGIVAITIFYLWILIKIFH